MPKSDQEFLKYYGNFKDKIYTFFLYRLNFNRAVAEDLTSEVFLKAFGSFTSFDANRSFQAWIYAIAKNHLSNYYRSANREVAIEQAETLGHEPHLNIDADLELKKVIAKIMSMEDYHREVLLLRYVDGLSNSEIADLLGKEEGAVRTQLSRACNTLREKINGDTRN